MVERNVCCERANSRKTVVIGPDNRRNETRGFGVDMDTESHRFPHRRQLDRILCRD